MVVVHAGAVHSSSSSHHWRIEVAIGWRHHGNRKWMIHRCDESGKECSSYSCSALCCVTVAQSSPKTVLDTTCSLSVTNLRLRLPHERSNSSNGSDSRGTITTTTTTCRRNCCIHQSHWLCACLHMHMEACFASHLYFSSREKATHQDDTLMHVLARFLFYCMQGVSFFQKCMPSLNHRQRD
jgi:hypothetical protein